MKTKIKLLSVALFAMIAFASCMKKPMACCDVPISGTVGQPVSFSSTCSMDASKYKWDFGDGNTSTEANPMHTYITKGTYTVKLMAMSKNENKMDETSKSITIN